MYKKRIFKKLSIDNEIYNLNDKEIIEKQIKKNSKFKHFFLNLVLCNTVLPIHSEKYNSLKYKGIFIH
jgi:hypothetical protein